MRICTQTIDKLDALYQSIRTELTECFEAIAAADTERETVDNDVTLSAIGRAQKYERIDTAKRAAAQRAERIADEAREQFAQIRADAVKAAGGRFTVRPQDIDRDAVTLLQSGILTDAELLNLADSYADNATMRRLIGKALTERAEARNIYDDMRTALAAKGDELTDTRTPLDKILDEYGTIFEAGTRPDATRANGIDRILYANALTEARTAALAIDSETE